LLRGDDYFGPTLNRAARIMAAGHGGQVLLANSTASMLAGIDLLLRELGQARADHSFEAVFRRYLAPDLLVLDDFGLHRLTPQQSEDLYALIIERHRRSSFIVTSNRDVSEWVGLFADPILANSALDRLANGAHQLVIDGPSYRAKLAPRPPAGTGPPSRCARTCRPCLAPLATNRWLSTCPST
jgi:DNA replication protein DnaC